MMFSYNWARFFQPLIVKNILLSGLHSRPRINFERKQQANTNDRDQPVCGVKFFSKRDITDNSVASLCPCISSCSCSKAVWYTAGVSDTDSFRATSFVSIDTMRGSCDLPVKLSSPSIARQTVSMSWIAAHSNAEPRAISKKRLRSLKLCLRFP